jgi:hypothetical protein
MSAAITDHRILFADATRTVLAEPPVPPELLQQVEHRDGGFAIEVAALFDGAVLQVRHFDNPAGGRLGRLTQGLLGSAFLALLGTLSLFAQSYIKVAKEKAAAQEQSTPFRSQRDGGRGRDAAAGGLLLYGIAALLYGLQRAGNERRENEFSIGSGPGATFAMDSSELPVERFPLVRSTGTDYEVLFTEAMAGELWQKGQCTPLAELRAHAQPNADIAGALGLRIPEGARLSLSHKDCGFLIRSVPCPRRYPVPLRLDWQAHSYTAAVLGGAACLLGLMFAVPPDPRSLSFDSFTNENLSRYLVKAQELKEEQAPWLKQQEPQQQRSSSARPARHSSGTAGNKEAPRRNDARFAIAGPKNNPDPKLAQKTATELARNIGIVGILNSGKLAALSAITGEQSALGNEAQDALGHLDGTLVADAYGQNAMGFVGVGRGGDGTGDNTIGIGCLSTQGGCNGNFRNNRSVKPVKLGNYLAHDPGELRPGPVQVIGGYDKDLIRRVIRQHTNEVRFCYERELTRDSSLSGRVVVKFSIGGMGTVLTSFVESSTLKASGADQCIASAVRRWQFPKPQGGLVIVSYPFVLKTNTGE